MNMQISELMMSLPNNFPCIIEWESCLFLPDTREQKQILRSLLAEVLYGCCLSADKKNNPCPFSTLYCCFGGFIKNSREAHPRKNFQGCCSNPAPWAPRGLISADVAQLDKTSAAKLAEKRGSEDRKIGTAMICRSLGIGSVISRINTNSTQISIARTTATVILACHRSQQCWFQFRKTSKFFERDKINQNFVSIVCICSVNLLCYLFGEIYLYFSWIVHTQKNLPIPRSHT